MSIHHTELLRVIEQIRVDANRLQLYALYNQYIVIMEHLHLYNGGLPIDGYQYNPEYLKTGRRSWLNDMREELQKKIKNLEITMVA